MLKLLFADRTMQGPCYHLTSVDWARNRLPGLHTHDYPEVFWITRGRCRHRVNGEDLALEVGDVVLMRAADHHALVPLDRSGFGFSNLSLNPGLFESWRKRFADDLRDLYPPREALPRMLRLAPRELDALNGEARLLSASAHTPLHLARFCFGIWARFAAGEGGGPADTGVPDWLREALLRLQEPELSAGGVPALVALCGRSHAHVSRVCRSVLGQTPHDLVTEARMLRAANDLRTTARSVTEIALDCGYAEAASFYRHFKRRFGVTPRRYRWPGLDAGLRSVEPS